MGHPSGCDVFVWIRGPLPHQHHVDAPEQVDLLSYALLSQLAYEERELVEPLARLGLG